MAILCVESEGLSASENMGKDVELLKFSASEKKAVLHLYNWKERALTYGYFVNPSDFLKIDALDHLSFDYAKRPTGGGILLHVCDFTFSLHIPINHPLFSLNTMTCYQNVHREVQKILEKEISGSFSLLEGESKIPSRFCMATPTQYDLLFNGKKIAGAAQRKIKGAFLHQGSINLSFPPESLLKAILKEEGLLEKMKKESAFLLEGATAKTISDIRKHLYEKFKLHFMQL